MDVRALSAQRAQRGQPTWVATIASMLSIRALPSRACWRGRHDAGRVLAPGASAMRAVARGTPRSVRRARCATGVAATVPAWRLRGVGDPISLTAPLD